MMMMMVVVVVMMMIILILLLLFCWWRWHFICTFCPLGKVGVLFLKLEFLLCQGDAQPLPSAL